MQGGRHAPKHVTHLNRTMARCSAQNVLCNWQNSLACSRPLLFRSSPIGCEPACVKAYAWPSDPHAQPQLEVPKCPQRTHQQEYLFILIQALRSVGDFKRVAD